MNGDHLSPHLAGPEQSQKTGAGASPHGRARRRRGGQKGNHNARKHAFYSSNLDPAEICEFWNIVNGDGIAPEIALLRIKLRSSLQRDPGNLRVLGDAARLLVRWYSARSRLDRTQTLYVKRVIRTMLTSLISAKRIDRTLTTEYPCRRNSYVRKGPKKGFLPQNENESLGPAFAFNVGAVADDWFCLIYNLV